MNPEEDCRTAVFDPPVEDGNVILSVEWRSGIADLPLAYSLKGSFDFEDNTYGVELPVYLFFLWRGGSQRWCAFGLAVRD